MSDAARDDVPGSPAAFSQAEMRRRREALDGVLGDAGVRCALLDGANRSGSAPSSGRPGGR